MANTVGKVIEVAKKEVGYLEKRSNKNLDSKTGNAGSGNYTKYNKFMGVNPAYWCASFVSWCFHEAYGESGKKLLCGAYSTYCETIRKNFLDKGQYFRAPQAGDLIFFTGTRHAGANHIGIVYKVSGVRVYTIEGNTTGGSAVVDNGGGVAYKVYDVGNSRIMGYGRPKYDGSKVLKGYDGVFPTLPLRGYYQLGDGYKTLKSAKGELQIKRVQLFLRWATTYDLVVDGDYGSRTTAACIRFQKSVGIEADGKFGKQTLARAKTYKR